tara:strand:- start:15324 stop:16550 length:1227 start_codon:yes stop_codon:yes gene_type:complete
LRDFIIQESTQHKIIFFLLAFFLITSPLKNSLNSVSVILLFSYSLLNYKNISLKKIIEFYPSYIYFIIVAVSIIYTADVEKGVTYLLTQVPFLIFPIVFSVIKINEKSLKKLMRIYIYWICLLILYSELSIIFGLLNNDESLYLLFRKDYSYINLAEKINIHPPYMMLHVSFCIIYLISNFGKSGINKTSTAIVLFIMFFYSVHLSSRLPLAGVSLITVVLLYKELNLRFGKVRTALLMFTSVFLLFLMIYNVRSTRYRFQELFGIQYSNGVYIKSGGLKLDQWSSGIEANNNIIFGNGIGDANNDIVESNYSNNLIKNAKLKYNAHNQYIQTYVGLGVLGVLSLLFLLYSLLVKCPIDELKTTAGTLFFYFLIVFMTESYLERHHGIVFISFLLCLCNYQKSPDKLL